MVVSKPVLVLSSLPLLTVVLPALSYRNPNFATHSHAQLTVSSVHGQHSALALCHAVLVCKALLALSSLLLLTVVLPAQLLSRPKLATHFHALSIVSSVHGHHSVLAQHRAMVVFKAPLALSSLLPLTVELPAQLLSRLKLAMRLHAQLTVSSVHGQHSVPALCHAVLVCRAPHAL
jgi:hypothetical protein